MIEFGETLRAAREAKAMTTSDLAEVTHMLKSVVEDLENENFTKIAAPIYGRGFVKLYCEAVGLDPKPMVECFMDIYNGKHEIKIKERPVKTVELPPQKEPTEQAVPTEKEDLFTRPQETEVAANSESVGYSRYSTPLRNYSSSFSALNPQIWRCIVLAIGAVLLITAIAWAIRSLYRATGGSAENETVIEQPQIENEPKTRQPKAVRPLYIDRFQ